MAATFRPVNTPTMANMADSIHDDSMPSPTTPRTSTAPIPTSRPADDATTPTRASFNAALAAQKPLPSSPFPESVQVPDTADVAKIPSREHSQRSAKSKDSDDMDMDDSDDEGTAGDDGAGSDDEEVNADGTKSKKKRSQRFYCREYPPCNLSFTRSEHLARHIRKHTGERPFQCHCSRRFSRLDNLRQHAQTVHINEDIPVDSLAATGTRFQRQIRTDRVRPTGRSRASTAGSVGPVPRGHSKSLSTSSIASMGSIGSAYGINEARRRPPPLIMAADPMSRHPFDTYRNPEPPQYYRPHSPSEFSTPNSATFSTGQGSPRWGSGVASPISSHSRSHSMYAGSRTPGRRLSVPSGGNPFQSPHGANLRGPPFNASMLNIPNSGAYSPSQSSMLSSPTASTSGWSRRDSIGGGSDEAWRRRTWHPDTRDPTGGTSRLNQVITPPRYPPVPLPMPVGANPPNQAPPTIRLPGIASFDPLPHRPRTPPRRIPSPMMIDSRGGPPPSQPPPVDYRRESTTQLQRGLNRLDINTPPQDSASAWANEAQQAVLARAEQPRPVMEPTVRFEPDVKPAHVPTSMPPSSGPPMHGSRHQYTMSAPLISTPRETKRHGWYHGPAVTVHPAGETIPEGRAHVDRIVHPNVSAFQGFPARESQSSLHSQSGHGVDRMERIMERPHPTNNARLEALVAVATSEGKAY